MNLKSTLRALDRAPGFTGFVVLVIALGFAACVLVGSFGYAFFHRKLPVPQLERLALALALRENFDPYNTTIEDYTSIAAYSRLAESVGVARNDALNLGRETPERVTAAAVANYFETLQVRPLLGRLFSTVELERGGPAVLLISHALWQRRYAGEMDIVGREEDVNGAPHTIIGVLPSGIDVPAGTDAWVPLAMPLDGAARLQRGCLTVIRMKPAVSLTQLSDELAGLNGQLQQRHPDHYRSFSLRAIPLRDQLLGDLFGRTKRTLGFIAAGLGLLLLLAAANIGSLLLARSIARRRELTVRQALGASNRDIIMPLLIESQVLAGSGGLLGILLAWALLPLVQTVNPVSAYALADSFAVVRLEPIVMLVALGLASLLGVVFAVLPAVFALRSSVLADDLRAGARSGASPRTLRFLQALLVGEIAIAATLLVTAGLLQESFRKLERLPLGFRTDNRFTLEIALPAARYPAPQAREQFVERLVAGARALPGVRRAAVTMNLPLSPVVGYDSTFEVEGREPTGGGNLPVTAHRVVTPEYASTLGLQLIAGRFLAPHDRSAQRPVVVVSDRFAREAWPNEEAVGKRVRRGVPNAPWLEVVGVVADVKEDRANFRIDRPVWYLSYYQFPSALPLSLVVELERPDTGIAAALRGVVREIDPQQPASSLLPLDYVLDGLTSTDRFGSLLMASLSVFGSLLASLGLFGVISYVVAQRQREFGIRLALGASGGRILRTVIGDGLAIGLVGTAIGLVAGGASIRLFSSLLFETNPFAPSAYVATAVFLAGVAVVASLVPAVRAVRVDPQTVLRTD